MKMTVKLVVFLLLAGIVSSCVNYEKTLLLKSENSEEFFEVYKDSSAYRIQSGDLLSIKVASPDAESAMIFNGTTTDKEASFLNSYQVNAEGQINFPMIGEVAIKGLTVDQVRDTLEVKLKSYFKFMTVTVRLISFQVTFIGEVVGPSTVVLKSDRIDFFQALSQVGGLTAFSNTSKVKVLRKLDDKVVVKVIDIGNSDFVKSDYYYLKPNDVVYIEPLRAKSRRENLPIVSLAFSLGSLIIISLNVLRQ